jgi:hypothetical protein
MRSGATYAELYLRPELQDLAAKGRKEAPFRVASIADAGWHPSMAWAYGLETVDGYMNLYPNRFHSYWEQVLSPLFAADTKRYKYNNFHYWGNQVYLFRPTSGFPPGTDIDFSRFYRLELLSLANVRYLISPHPLRHPDLVLLARGGEGALPGLRERMQNYFRGQPPAGKLYLYENRQALPRFFAVTSFKVLADETLVLQALGAASVGELRSTAYLAKSDAAPVAGLAGLATPAKVLLRRYGPNDVELEVDAPGPSLIVNATTYSPFWKAQIDGLSSALFPVDHAFQGVVVGSGRHRVVFRYEPPYARALLQNDPKIGG